MRTTLVILVILTVSTIAVNRASCEGFTMIGPRAMGMGGAFVSVANDPSAMYWNPAQMIAQSGWNISWFQGNDAAKVDDFLDDLYQAAGITLAAASQDPNVADQLIKALKTLNQYRIPDAEEKHMAFAIYHGKGGIMLLEDSRYVAASQIDLVNIGTGEGSESPIGNNQSRMVFGGLKRTQFITSYSYVSKEMGMLIGANLKYIQVRSFYQTLSLWDIPQDMSLNDMLREAKHENGYNDKTFSWDLAISAVTGNGHLAVMAKDLTGYKIDRGDSEQLKVKPAYRIGYSTPLASGFMVAVDYDLTANRDELSTKSDRRLCWGMEKWFGAEKGIAIRGGFFQRIGSQESSPYVYTAGLGFKFKWLQGDLGGMMDADRQNLGLNLAVTIIFP